MRSSLPQQSVVRLGAPSSRIAPVVLASSFADPRSIAPTRLPASTSSIRKSTQTLSRTVLMAPAIDIVDHPEEVFLASREGGTFFARMLALLITPMIVLQPILPLYAADETVAPPVDTASSSPVVSETPPSPPTDTSVDTPSSSGQETSPSGDVSSSTTTEGIVSPPASSGGDVLGVATSTDDASVKSINDDVPSSVGGAEATTSLSLSDSSTTPPHEEEATTSEEATSVPSSATTSTEASDQTENSSNDLSQSQESTTSPEDAASAEQAEKLKKEEEARVHEELLRREMRKEVEAEFTKGCVSLESSGYYCLSESARSWTGNLAPSEGITAVSSEADGKGSDKEIFVTKGGKKIQLTDNDQEDAFPAFDFDGNMVVWQEMQNGRWQIFYATVASGTPELHQLTNSTESNFNPTVHSGVIAWQGWVDGNWEIFLAIPRTGEPSLSIDQLTPEHHLVGVNGDWDVKRLTTNTTHDMFPAIAGDMVTWQSFEGGNWGIVTYSLKTGVTTRVSDGGKKSERPRFALLWNEESDSGNMHMKGYDIASGKTTDITDEAKRIPDVPKPVTPPAPISGPDQAALPSVGVHASVTPPKDDSDDDTASSTPSV